MKRFVLALLLLFASVALAEQIIGTGEVYWSRGHTTPLADGCITNANGSAVCALFPAYETDDRVNTFTSITGDVTCVWAGPAVTLDADAHITAGGSNGTGPGAGMRLPSAGARWDERPNAKLLMEAQRPGMADGFCPTRVCQVRGIDCLFAPCRIASTTTDCVDYGGGTCIAPTPVHWESAGLRVVCDGAVFAQKQVLTK